MSNRIEHTLLGDIGATNARFALFGNGVLGPVKVFEVAHFARFPDAVSAFLRENCGPVVVTSALFAIAGPVQGERCLLTNCSWTIDVQELRTRFNWAKARLVNDFEATAFSLPCLTATDLYGIGGGRAVSGAPRVVLGPGSGLGVSCLVTGSQGAVAIASEGGHATLAGMSSREDAIIHFLRQRFGHVSVERTVSGPGLENIYQAIASLDRKHVPSITAAEITKNALDGGSPIAHSALETFCAFLGAFAGNIALTFGARGGVYIAGGIAPRIVEFMARSEFRLRFEAKGRFRPYLETIPSNVIMHSAATFLGLKFLVASNTDA
jgi:glucokinase